MSKTKSIFLILILVTSCGTESATDKNSNQNHWSYEGETGPEHWDELEKNNQCNGLFQSPINLVNFSEDKNLNPLDLHYADSTKIHSVENNGHTIKYNFEKGDYLIYNAKRFNLVQFHFHEPAEHLIEGVRYPLEIHLVHTSEEGEICVLGIMAKEGKNSEPFEFLERFLPLEQDESKLINKSFDIQSTLPENQNYFTYKGSLTTPPCTENVTWFVFKEPINVSEAQVELLRGFMPINNYRDHKPQNGRIIKLSHF
ncbi:MAG: carbonic anhydrase [Psychroflexus salarius]